MSTEILIALSNAVAGREAEFEQWYWGTHLAEVLTVPGIVAAQPYRLPGDPGPGAPFRYATVYTVEGSADEARGRLYSTPGFSSSEAMDYSELIMAPFIPVPTD